MSESANTSYFTITYRIDHDFNRGRNEGGFHEAVIDPTMEDLLRSGMIVKLVSEDVEVRGRIRCLVAVVEEVPDSDG